jgi:hypothetical protein
MNCSTFLTLALTVAASISPAKEVRMNYDKLIPALVRVESNGNAKAVGDNGKALGILQIWSVVVQDVNAVYGTKFAHKDAFEPKKAEQICRLYLSHYCSAKRLGRKPTYEDAARIWNGGPMGHRKSATLGYWAKVKKHI